MIRTCLTAFALLAAAPALAACDPEERILTLSHGSEAAGNPRGEAAAAFAALANAELDGTLCIEVAPDASFYGDADALAAVARGDLALAVPSLSTVASVDPRFQVFDLPFLFEDPLAAMAFMDSPEAEDMRMSLGQGIVGLAYWMDGMKQLAAPVALRMPSDAAGLRFGVEPSDVNVAKIAALGAEPVALGTADVAAELASGRIDGQQDTWAHMLTDGTHAQHGAITQTDHAYAGYLVVASAEVLDSLDPATRQTLLTALELTTHERNRFAYEINEAARQRILAAGTQIVGLGPAEKEAWRIALLPVWREVTADIGRDLVGAAARAGAGGR